jgi:hypothetical protein
MMTVNKKKHGFTFVEFLLGFLIFSIMAVALYSTFASGLKIQKRANSEGLLYHQAKMSLDMIARELESSLSFNFSQSYPALKPFEAGRQRFSFLIADRDQIKRVTYYAQDPDKAMVHKILLGQRSQKNVAVTNIRSNASLGEVVLMRREELLAHFVNGQNDVSSQEEIILDHIEEKSFKILYAYLTTEKGATTLQWQEGWDKDYLPAGVRLEMTLRPSGQSQKVVSVVKDIYIPTGFWEEAS